jgi:hypothetical protein
MTPTVHMASIQKVVFVYNADAGRLNAILDSAHKLISPDTYQCALCEITHGAFGERKAWQEFKKSLALPVVFYHRDEFESATGQRYEYPVVLGVTAQRAPVVLLDAGQIAQCQSVEEFGNALNQSLTIHET